MASALDLTTFKPESAEDLFKGILKEISSVLIANYKEVKNEISIHLQSVAKKAWLTQVGLQQGTISREHADIAIHTQELALSSIVLYSAFMAYDTAQRVLNAVFSVITSAIRNLTGIQLSFG